MSVGRAGAAADPSARALTPPAGPAGHINKYPSANLLVDHFTFHIVLRKKDFLPVSGTIWNVKSPMLAVGDRI
jgi:hypothetical protein